MFNELKRQIEVVFQLFSEPENKEVFEFNYDIYVSAKDILTLDNAKDVIKKQCVEELIKLIFDKTLSNQNGHGISVLTTDEFFDQTRSTNYQVDAVCGVVITKGLATGDHLVTDNKKSDYIKKDQKPDLLKTDLVIDKRDDGWHVSAMCKVAM